MASCVRRTAATLFAATALGVGIATPASAQPQNGLVNVFVGDDVVNVEDVSIGVAAQIAAEICGFKVGPVAVLGRAVDRSGTTETVCSVDQGPVTLRQI